MRDRLRDAGELLYRQIRKDQIDEGQPGSHAFRPLPKDQNMLSLDRGALTTPREAHAVFIENGFESVRVYGIAVGEFSSESIPSYSDPLSAPATQEGKSVPRSRGLLCPHNGKAENCLEATKTTGHRAGMFVQR
jgi:hypothetical protein